MHSRWRPSPTLLTIGAWAFVAAVFVAQNIVGALGRGRAISLENDVLYECVYWIAFAALYGDRYRLDMQPAIGGGTVVTLRLPLERIAERN